MSTHRPQRTPTPRRRHSLVDRPHVTLLIAVVVTVVVAAGLAACGGSTTPPAPTVTVTASSTTFASPTTSTSASPTAVATTPMIAVASGYKSDTLALIDPNGVKTVLVPGDGHPIVDVQISPGGDYIAYTRLSGLLYSLKPSTLMIYSFASGMSKPVPFVDIAPATVGGHIWVTQTDLVVTAFASMPKNATTNGTLYLCDLTTLPATPLRDDSGTALQGDLPSASAGGKWLTFITYSNYKPPKVNSSGAYTSGGSVTETLRVFGPSSVVQTVSSAKRMLDVEGSPFGKATISPDGGKIFTQQTGSDIGFGAKIYNTDGSKPKAFGPFVYPGGGAWDRSGSGNLIFAGSMDKNAATSGLLLYGQGVTQIFKTKKYYISDVTWSPDGQWIAFAAVPMTIDAKAPDVWVISIDGSSLTLLAKHAASPSWGMVAQP